MTQRHVVLAEGSDILSAKVTIDGIVVPFHLTDAGLSISTDLVHEFYDGVNITVTIKRLSAAKRIAMKIAPPGTWRAA